MSRGLTDLLVAAAEPHLRGLRLAAATAAAVALCGAVSLGFATFAAYLYLSAWQGPAVAALIICATYGLAGLSIRVIGSRSRHSGRRPRPSGAPAPAAAPDNNAAVESLVATAVAGTPESRLALDAAMQLGRELSPMQLLALALIGGFIAGRKLRK